MSLKPDAATELKRLIRRDGRSLSSIAESAGVAYNPLWRWVTGRQPTYNLLCAERVFFCLTGRTFMGVGRKG